MSGKRQVILRLLSRVNRLLPESAAKNRMRALLLGARPALPRELMVGPGQTAVQVGMWRRGNLARLSRCVGSAGRVILIEADRRAVEDLAVFCEAEHLANVTLVHKGAFSRKGRQEFRLGVSPVFSRIAETDVDMLSEANRDPVSAVEQIEVDTVDNILAEHAVSDVDYLEITVNGLELPVLEGMETTLPVTSRIFLSGYGRVRDTGEPTNQRTASFLHDRGFRTKISRRSKPPRPEYFDEKAAAEWGLMEGNVFAWRD